MKKLILFVLVLLCANVVFGQTNNERQRIAIFVIPNDEIEPGVMREINHQTINTLQRIGRYLIIERNEAFSDEVERELGSFVLSGAVREDHILRMGQQFGAEIVCVIELGRLFGEYVINMRFVDVETRAVVRSGRVHGNFKTLAELGRFVDQAISDLFYAEMARERAIQDSINRAENERRFNEAMQSGERNLRNRQFEVARSYFQSATSIMPEKAQTANQRIIAVDDAILAERFEIWERDNPRLTIVGRGTYGNGIRLTNYEVRNIMQRTSLPASRLYRSGRNQQVAGTAYLILGGIFSAVGIGLLIGGDSNPDNSNPGGGIAIAVGAGFCILGIVFRVSGSSRVRNAVNMYNNRRVFSDANTKFGVTENGVGLVLNF